MQVFDTEARQLFAEANRDLHQFHLANSLEFDENNEPSLEPTMGMPPWGFYMIWDGGDPENGPQLYREFVADDGRPIRIQEKEYWTSIQESWWEENTRVSNI